MYTQPLFELVNRHSVLHHAFANDNQLYKESLVSQIQPTIPAVEDCVADVKAWMTQNKLQLNDTKTESMLVKSHRFPPHVTLPATMHIGDTDVGFVHSVKNLALHLTVT